MTNVDIDVKELTKDEVGGPGLASLLSGYLSYAEEIILRRAIPNLYDGLKPSQRFIMWVMYEFKTNNYIKSNNFVGRVGVYNPHGDAANYETLVRMVDNNGTMLIPYISGKGNWGKSFSNKGAAAQRYTDIKKTPYFDEFFDGLDGVNFQYDESGAHKYPSPIPVSFPTALVNESNGLAVGIATKIPSFNLKEILELIEHYIQTGEMNAVLVPDFSTKGYVINDQKEFTKIMQTGRGRIKLRAKTEIHGREIYVKELPYGVTIEKLNKEIERAEINNLINYDNLSGLENGLEFVISCRSAASVDQVLLELYNKTSLQVNYHANMLFIDKDKPVQLGVYDVIRRWVDWRKGVIQLAAQRKLLHLNKRLEIVEAFIKVIRKEGFAERLLTTIPREGTQAAIKLLRDELGIDETIGTWICNRKASQYDNGGKYQKEYQDLVDEKAYLLDIFDNPEKQILRDIERLKANKDLIKPRQTQITNKDYVFVAEKKTEEEVIELEECYYVIDKEGFLKKYLVKPITPKETDFVLKGYSNDVIISIDENGGIFRTYGEDIDYTKPGELGVYIPRYAGLPETNILWNGIANKNEKKLLIYNDGYVGFLDLTPFSREMINQKSKYMTNGINKAVDQLIDIIDMPDAEDYLVVEDISTRKNKLGLIQIKDIEEKARTSRVKVMNAKQTSNFAILTKEELDMQLDDIEEYRVTKENRKMVPYPGVFPKKMEDYQQEAVGTYADVKNIFDNMIEQ